MAHIALPSVERPRAITCASELWFHCHRSLLHLRAAQMAHRASPQLNQHGVSICTSFLKLSHKRIATWSLRPKGTTPSSKWIMEKLRFNFAANSETRGEASRGGFRSRGSEAEDWIYACFGQQIGRAVSPGGTNGRVLPDCYRWRLFAR